MTTEFPSCYGCFINPSWPWNIPQTIPAQTYQPIYENLPAPPPHAPPLPMFFMDTNGLTPDEKEVIEHLVQAYNKFVALLGKHPSDDFEFCQAIHDAQKMLALRVARRVNPDVWKQYPEGVDNS